MNFAIRRHKLNTWNYLNKILHFHNVYDSSQEKRKKNNVRPLDFDALCFI
jgi:hypothetical protein